MSDAEATRLFKGIYEDGLKALAAAFNAEAVKRCPRWPGNKYCPVCGRGAQTVIQRLPYEHGRLGPDGYPVFLCRTVLEDEANDQSHHQIVGVDGACDP